MPRPCCPRHIDVTPCAVYFKPAGVPLRFLEESILTLDELEALRLADLNGLHQEKAAGLMKISRPTFARIVELARRKTADALIHGKAIRLEGGTVVMKGGQTMPGGDGTGPRGGGRGMGLGSCGGGRRRGGRGGNGGPGMGRGGRRRRGKGQAVAAVVTPAKAVKPARKTKAKS